MLLRSIFEKFLFPLCSVTLFIIMVVGAPERGPAFAARSDPSLHRQSCPPTGCPVERFYGYQPPRYAELRHIFYVAASNSLGESGPPYTLINHDLPPEMVQESLSPQRPIPHLLLRAIAWQESHWLHFAGSVGDPDDRYACTLLSGDCGYGLMQVTSCMDDGCGWFAPTRVSSDYAYNLSVGTNVLVGKWNAVPFLGENDHTVAEEWYYAVTAYNGWSRCNDPNREVYLASCPPGIREPFDPARPPYGEGAYTRYTYPYQEIVWGLMAHPEQAPAGVHPLWRPTRVPHVPRGIFGLGGDDDWRPPYRTPRPVTHILPDLHLAGAGAAIRFHNPTSETLSADVAFYNENHTFKRRWLPDPHPFRLAPGASYTLHLSELFSSTLSLAGYVRVDAGSGMEVEVLPERRYFEYRTFLPLTAHNYGALCYQAVENGGFEHVQDGSPRFWSAASSGEYALSGSTWFRSGNRAAYLGGYDDAEDSLGYTLQLPSGAASAVLNYAWYVRGEELTLLQYDVLRVRLRDPHSGELVATLDEIDNRSPCEAWHHARVNLLPYAGRDLRLTFEAEIDGSNPTAFFVDDVSVTVCIP